MPLQLHQALNLLLLLLVGLVTANLYLSLVEIGLILLFTLLVEHLFLFFNPHRELYFSYASLSTAIGVILLMYSSSLWIYFIVITLGLAQKHFLTLNQRHFFNPSNFALMMALLFFYNDAHIISGQFGDELWFSLLVAIVAMVMLIRVKRWLITLLFIGFYLGLQYSMVVSYDPMMLFEEVYHRFYSVTFMLFIYFMLTDPMVTPNSWKRQILFAFFIAFLATLLDRLYGFRVQHLFMVVFFLSFFVNFLSLKHMGKQEIKQGVIILLFTVAVLGYIEMQEPYYFEMNG